MLERTMTTQRLTQAIVLAAASLLWAANASAANEQRCTDLGANCVCSEPMNTNVWVDDAGDTQNWNPGDTTSSDKQCGDYNGWPHAPLSTSSPGMQAAPASSGEDIDALPAGHSLTHVLRLNT